MSRLIALRWKRRRERDLGHGQGCFCFLGLCDCTAYLSQHPQILPYRCGALSSVHGNVNLTARLTPVLSFESDRLEGRVPAHVELTVTRLKSIYYLL